MAASIDPSDPRIQLLLKAVKVRDGGASQRQLWDLELARHGTGYHGRGSFNFGYVERTMPRLIREGYLKKGRWHTLGLTDKGHQEIQEP